MKKTFIFIFVGVLCAFIIIAGISWFALQISYSQKILPMVKISGEEVGGLTLSEANEKINNIFSQKKIVFFNNDKTATIGQNDLGVKFNTAQAIDSAYQFGRTKLKRNINLEASIDQQKLSDFLNRNFPESIVKPTDAHFGLNEKNELIVVPAETGLIFDLEKIETEIKKSLVGGQDTVALAMKKTGALISGRELETLKPEAENFLANVPKIKIDYKEFTPTIDQKFGFFKVGVSEGEPKIIINEENVKNYLADLNKKTIIKSRPDVVYNTGETIEVGSDGKAIDQNAAYQALVVALTNQDNKTLVFERKVLPKNQTILEKGFTPGLFPGKYIEVDLSSQVLYQMEGENVIAGHRVSTGKWSMPTPEGTFAINNKDPRAYSRKYDLYMPYWMSFVGHEYGIHELPEWPNGAKEGEGHLGTPVSHGCIRLGIGDAQQVYDWAEIGTPVVVHK